MTYYVMLLRINAHYKVTTLVTCTGDTTPTAPTPKQSNQMRGSRSQCHYDCFVLPPRHAAGQRGGMAATGADS